MHHPTGGSKRSSWLTFRRRLLLVRLLLRGPMSRAGLIAEVHGELGENGYPPAAESALKHDLDALKSEFGCRIKFQRGSQCYCLEDLGELALLDLPDIGMEALASLEATFPAGAALPEHAGIRALLDRMVLLLPPDRQQQHQHRRNVLTLRLIGTSPGKIDPDTLAKAKRAVNQGRELAFSYLGPASDGVPRRHRVAPYGIFFRPEGHGYLDATRLDTSLGGGEMLHATTHYRLDRIVAGSVKVLPTMLPPDRLRPPKLALRYHLDPSIARRRDVAVYFDDSVITYHDDGGATITATITSPWHAWQTLLRYGEGCIVEEPPEVVALFQATVGKMAQQYAVCIPQN